MNALDDGGVESGNYLNLSADDLDRNVYRIVSFERLREMFETNVNVLVSPECWDDPFENFILKCPVILESGETAHVEFHDQYFGQCWTLKSASDAMWRIYSPDSRGIRIRTTIRKLAQSLASHEGEWDGVSAFIGKVRYLSKKKMKAFAEQTWHSTRPAHFAQTLLAKRPAFEHEAEVRLIYWQRETRRNGQKHYSYRIDPNDLIDQVMCDPRLDKEEYRTVRGRIRAAGFRGNILRSLLYAPPPKFELRF